MSQVTKCDRCGKVDIPNKSWIETGETRKVEATRDIAFDFTGQMVVRIMERRRFADRARTVDIDLCQDCAIEILQKALEKISEVKGGKQ